jgi:two-component system sensor histidine kinase CiaH
MHTSRSILRLTLSYWVIITLLSIGFSSVFYITSSNELSKQLAPPSIRNGTQPLLQKQQSVLRVSDNTSLPTANSIPGVNQGVSLEQRVAQSLDALLRNLILLNAIACVFSILLSYYLAKRTLKPIQAAMDAQSRFASDASHELRTPLTVLQSENEAALRTLELPEHARAVFKSNLEEIAQLKNLTEGLLRLAHETEGVPLQSVRADQVAALAVKYVAKLAHKQSVSIRNLLLPTQVLADEQSLMQVVLILLDNAIKYGGQRTTIRIEGRADKKHFYLSVQDEGPGIASADLGHIFDRFYRSERSRRQYSTGHGLGLAIARKLVVQQGGSITVESTPGKGSTFTVKLAVATHK